MNFVLNFCRIFLLVLLTSVAGFAIAFHGLFHDLYNFHTIEMTFRTLFDAALGQHDFSIFDNNSNDWLHHAGITLYFLFITFTMGVLINLVIARMAVRNLSNAVT